MEKTLKVEGMTCGHCVGHVEEALKEIKGVSAVKVSLEDGTAIVTSEAEIATDIFKEAIEEAGYELV